jgi:hypothetical protein
MPKPPSKGHCGGLTIFEICLVRIYLPPPSSVAELGIEEDDDDEAWVDEEDEVAWDPNLVDDSEDDLSDF